jgi:hypothetical protein
MRLAASSITQNTFRDFTLAEVLLMAAINQLEAKRKLAEMRDAYGTIPA